MSKYVDIYLLPIKAENVDEYKALAKKAGKFFIKHGALSYREYVASDLTAHGMVPVDKMTKAKEGETVIFAIVEYKSEAQRNKSIKATMEDAEMNAMMPADGKAPFNWKRMSYGGFKNIVNY